MTIDVRKVLTDAGYVSIGLGVLGYQQAQTRRRDLQGRLGSAGECFNGRAQGLQARVDDVQGKLDERTRDMRDKVDARTREVRVLVEEQTRAAIDRIQELGDELGRRVEPLVERLPEPVAKVVEPLRIRVRALAGSAA